MNTRTVLGFALGPVATAAISLVSVPAIAWAFSPEDVARYNLLQIFVSFCVLLLTLGLDQGYVRQFHEAEDTGVLLRTCIAPGALLITLLAVPTLVGSRSVAEFLFGVSDGRVFPIALACATAALISRFLSLVLRMEERALAFSVSQVIPKAVFLLGVGAVLIVSVSRDFFSLASAFLASWVAVVLITGWNTRWQWRSAVSARIDRALARDLVRYSVPLTFAALAYWALTATSAMALRYLSTLSELGVYSVALSFAGVAVVVQTIFSVVWAPVVYRWVAQDSDLARVEVVTHQALAVVTAIFVACGALSWLTDLVLPSAYGEVKYLVLGSIAQPLLYTLSEVTGIGINISRHTVWSVWCTLVALVVSVALNVLLVPEFGARGAVGANTIAYLIFFVARTEASAFTWRSHPRKRLYVVTTVAVVGALATIAWGPGSGNLYSVVWVATVPLLLWLFRDQWVALLRLRGVWSS